MGKSLVSCFFLRHSVEVDQKPVWEHYHLATDVCTHVVHTGRKTKTRCSQQHLLDGQKHKKPNNRTSYRDFPPVVFAAELITTAASSNQRFHESRRHVTRRQSTWIRATWPTATTIVTSARVALTNQPVPRINRITVFTSHTHHDE